MRFGLACLVAAVAGCTVPLPPIEIDAGRDASMPVLDAPTPELDAPTVDAGEADDAPAQDDAPAVDAGSDAGSPDAGSDCTARYGAAPLFMLCAETAMGCEFFARTTGSCNALCMGLGGTCLAAYNDMGGTCERTFSSPCAMTYAEQICICSR